MRRLALTALLGCPLLGFAQAVAPCGLLSAQDIASATRVPVGKLTADEPATLTRQQVPGLPAGLRIDQCIGPVRLSGAVPVRIGLMRADRTLSSSEWRLVDKALESPEERNTGAATPTGVADANCWVHSWRPKQQTLHEVACSRSSGPWHLTITLEHEDPSQLPPMPKVAALLASAMARLPAR